jgi:acyl carrier protein
VRTGNDHEDHSVAIVGAACRLPGGIDDLDGPWRALVEGRDLAGEVPSDRFDLGQGHYGMDSLMAAELLISARRRFDVDTPPLELARSGGSVADITELIHLRLGLRRPERTSS